MVDSYDFGFAAPKGWDRVDEETIQASDAYKALLDDISKRSGKSAIELGASVADTELWLYSDKQPRNGFLDNINVEVIPGATRTVSDRELRASFESADVSVGFIDRIETSSGETVTVPVSVVTGDGKRHGVSVIVDIGDVWLNITVSSSVEAEASRIADLIVSGL